MPFRTIKLKIIHIIPNLNKGGAQRLVLDICTELNKNNTIEVVLITFTNKNEYPLLTTNLNWQVIHSEYIPSIIQKAKVKITELNNFIQDFKPAIIHTHLFEAEIVSRSCTYIHAKWFTHCHDNMPQFDNFSWKTIFNKQLITHFYEKKYLLSRYKINGGNRFITISTDTHNYFRNRISNFPLKLLRNAIDFNLFNNTKKTESGAILQLINIGSLVDKKNQKLLIEIGIILKQQNIKFNIHIIGDGPNKEKLNTLISQHTLTSEIILHGNINNVEEYLWNSDIYIHTATYEPFGLVLLEAMAAGIPVISLDGQGNRDIIKNGVTGLMIHQPQASLFVEAIIKLINNKDFYNEIAINANNYAKEYDIKEYTNSLLNLYTQL